MSVRVDPDELAEHLQQYGYAPYLITTGADLRPHTTHVVVAFVDGQLSMAVGRKTAANASDRPNVSLLWMPFERGGFSLIVDGNAFAASEGDTHRVDVAITAAVLHRNADPDGGYAADCEPLDGRH